MEPPSGSRPQRPRASAPESGKNIPRSVAAVLREHVVLEVESIDRMYLNVYVPRLQKENWVAAFFRFHRGYSVPSSVLMSQMTKAFVESIEAFAQTHQVPLITFPKGQRKEEVAAQYLARFHQTEGVLFIGKAQEKTPVFRTQKQFDPKTGRPYTWIVRSTAMVNHYYCYCVDRDFGLVFLKFSSYFPYSAKLYLNGHEYAKRQLQQANIQFQALDNGILSCADPQRLQEICDGLSPEKIDALLRKWLDWLPHPFTPEDRRAGYLYDISILQAEFSLTQVLDRPVSGRIFFEEVIRENLDLGRPEHVQLIFARQIRRNTPSRFRTRVITEGVIPSLHLDYKSSRIKQYHKEGRALRTETTINNTWDFNIGKRLHNLPTLRQIGFQANRRLLDVQCISHDCILAEETFQQLNRPRQCEQQRTSAFRFADATVQAVCRALTLFQFLPGGFSNRDLREQLASLKAQSPDQITSGAMTYQLRRLRLHGIIERIPKTHRYRLTAWGFRIILFFNRLYARILRPGIAQLLPHAPLPQSSLRRAFDNLENQIADWIQKAKLTEQAA